MARAESITVESDERGFELHFTVDEEPEVDESGRMVVNIQACDLDTFYDQVKGRIGPYLQERDAVREEFSLRPITSVVELPAFRCNPDESGGVEERVVAVREDGSYRVEPDEDAYDPMDPKHPRFHSVHVDHWDNREKA